MANTPALFSLLWLIKIETLGSSLSVPSLAICKVVAALQMMHADATVPATA